MGRCSGLSWADPSSALPWPVSRPVPTRDEPVGGGGGSRLEMSPGMAEASCLRIFLSETQSLNPQPRPQPVTSLSHLLLYLSAARFITAPELPDSSRPPPPNPNPAAPLTGRRQARARRSERGGAGRGGRCWPPIGRWVGRGRGGGCEGAGRARGRGLARLPQLPAGAGGPGSAPPCGEQVGLRGGGGG